jgi:hypothetical protein
VKPQQRKAEVGRLVEASNNAEACKGVLVVFFFSVSLV